MTGADIWAVAGFFLIVIAICLALYSALKARSLNDRIEESQNLVQEQAKELHGRLKALEELARKRGLAVDDDGKKE